MVVSMCDDVVDAQRRCLVVADRFTVLKTSVEVSKAVLLVTKDGKFE